MHILVINCGSSSLRLAVLDTTSGLRVAEEKVTRIEEDGHAAALREVLPRLVEGRAIAGVGHRVVHGGAKFSAPVRITEEVIAEIEALCPLAPLHNPANLAGIRAARALLSEVPHVAVFDTAFHASLPTRARTYALDLELQTQHGLRRYGFHGTSHELVARRAAEHLGEPIEQLRLVTCHLGNGASVTAIEGGHSVETSMGMTPLEGLVMGTRSGDVDSGILLHLLRGGMTVDALDALLNEQSGLAGLSGVSNDLRDLERRAGDGDERCRLAIQVFAHRVRKYIGAYAAVMGGVDAIVFTGGIGENSALMRHRIAQRLDFLGARFDEDRNRDVHLDGPGAVAEISDARSRVRILVAATDEELAIAQHTAALVRGRDRVDEALTIPIAISARHIHLTQAAVETLFGPGHQLTPLKPLSQPGQYASVETLTVVGPKRQIEGVRVLGPARPANQVEISRTDEFFLGVDAPVRLSGEVAHTPSVTLVGPHGSITTDGLICARRHIHMTPGDAERFGVKHGDEVEVRVGGGPRDLVFSDVSVRVSEKFRLEMHIDTDEGNAAELNAGAAGVLEGTEGTARLVRRRAGVAGA